MTMKFTSLKNLFAAGAILFALGCPAFGQAPAGSFAEATNVLTRLIQTKTLRLASLPESPSASPVTPVPGLREFAFVATLARSGHDSVIHRVTATPEHVSIAVLTPDGQPYLLLTDHCLVVCDATHPGSLASSGQGSAFWGLYQGESGTNMQFQMGFAGTTARPAAVLDAGFIARLALQQTVLPAADNVKASYLAPQRKIIVKKTSKTRTTMTEFTLAPAAPAEGYGLERLRISTTGVVLDFSDFQTGPAVPQGFPRLAPEDLARLNVPVRPLDAAELKTMPLYPPDGFPRTPEERTAAAELKKLISAP